MPYLGDRELFEVETLLSPQAYGAGYRPRLWNVENHNYQPGYSARYGGYRYRSSSAERERRIARLQREREEANARINEIHYPHLRDRGPPRVTVPLVSPYLLESTVASRAKSKGSVDVTLKPWRGQYRGRYWTPGEEQRDRRPYMDEDLDLWEDDDRYDRYRRHGRYDDELDRVPRTRSGRPSSSPRGRYANRHRRSRSASPLDDAYDAEHLRRYDSYYDRYRSHSGRGYRDYLDYENEEELLRPRAEDFLANREEDFLARRDIGPEPIVDIVDEIKRRPASQKSFVRTNRSHELRMQATQRKMLDSESVASL